MPDPPYVPGQPVEVRVGPEFAEEFPGAQASATEAVMNLARTSGLVLSRIAEVTQRFGLSPAGMNVLTILEHAPSPLPPRAIGEALVVTSSTVTGVLDSLEKRGLIRRTSHPGDRRMLLIEITGAGHDLVRAMGPPLVQGEMDWLSCLTPDEQEILIRLLGRIQGHLLNALPEPAT
jgi:DNA-binding MarR family transcriptional regulator